MKKKYTVEEIKGIYENVEREVLEKLSNDMEKAEKNIIGTLDDEVKLAYLLHNLKVITLLNQKLFEKLK